MVKSILMKAMIILVMCFVTSQILQAQDAKTDAKPAPTEEDATTETPAKSEDPGLGYYLKQVADTGLTGIALALVAIVGFGFALERAFKMRKSHIVPDGLAKAADELWRKGDLNGIKVICEKRPSTLSRLLMKILRHKDSSKEEITQIVNETATREMRRHIQKAYPMAVAAAVSPLLGLFGTVVGMINAFKNVALAGEMGDPTKMAGDISFALMTTALGLVIAMPCIILYHFFKIKATMIALDLEETASELLLDWFGISYAEVEAHSHVQPHQETEANSEVRPQGEQQ